MSLRIVGHDAEGHRIVIDEGPNQATVRNRGGLALGQALTASQIKPVASLDFGRPVADVTPPLREGAGVAGGERAEAAEVTLVRIQRSRAKGWRMPAGAVYVGRPSRWGNPFYVTRAAAELRDVMVPATDLMSRFVVVTAYRSWLTAEVNEHLTIDLAPLRGHDLVCWCPLDQPCHADVLLELANA